MSWDPRTSRRYQAARKAWLPTADPVCCLCGCFVDVTLPARLPAGPSVEHTVPVRVILATTQSRAEALDMACDTSLWGLAHKLCQDRQGAQVTNSRHQPRGGSRRW